jgi:hypothetical protein
VEPLIELAGDPTVEPDVGIFGFATKYESFTRIGSNCGGRETGKGFLFEGHRLLCEDFEASSAQPL